MARGRAVIGKHESILVRLILMSRVRVSLSPQEK
jgi:hypothetical protein